MRNKYQIAIFFFVITIFFSCKKKAYHTCQCVADILYSSTPPTGVTNYTIDVYSSSQAFDRKLTKEQAISACDATTETFSTVTINRYTADGYYVKPSIPSCRIVIVQ